MVPIWRGDADTKIVSAALELSKGLNVIVVGMLLYHHQNQISVIFFPEERGKKCWSVKEALKEFTCKEHLAFFQSVHLFFIKFNTFPLLTPK